ncbi:hypothetical protein IV203_013594 [Nitzschia inconspicua]|uniref:Uncharacterized protein n=1 Tax=Nitzschia inconspicua TaxID=303405 RepID=A0A9K3M5V9_9STRA|nr:hypothetical protein IV203_013594 [Nitzschia inconspicua]
MGPQSQRRNTLAKRTAKLKGSAGYRNKKKTIAKAGDQLTLTSEVAFDVLRDCDVCIDRRLGKKELHRAHHKLCPNNRRTRRITSKTTLESNKYSKKLKKHFAAPLKQSEKLHSSNVTPEALTDFLEPRKRMATTNDGQDVSKKLKSPPPSSATAPLPSSATTKRTTLAADDFYDLATATLNNEYFVETVRNKTPPLAILALATVVAEQVLDPQKSKVPYHDIFDGISMRVPDCSMSYDNPYYHSIVGQSLPVVDWKKAYGLEVPCPNCNIPLLQERSRWSRHKTLFPIFGIDGPPKWAIVVPMWCSCCGYAGNSNDGRILRRLPAYAAASYPVEPKFAQGGNFHVARTATELFDTLMTTYGNGDLCSRLLYNAINREYLSKVSSYYSYYKTHPSTSGIIEYPVKDGQYITVFPPNGSTIRNLFEEAFKEPNRWGSMIISSGQEKFKGSNV